MRTAQQIVAVLTSKDRIAAATYRIKLNILTAHWKFPILCSEPGDDAKLVRLWGEPFPHVTHSSSGPPESIPQMTFRSVRPFQHSCHVAVTNRHIDTYRQPASATTSLHLCTAASKLAKNNCPRSKIQVRPT